MSTQYLTYKPTIIPYPVRADNALCWKHIPDNSPSIPYVAIIDNDYFLLINGACRSDIAILFQVKSPEEALRLSIELTGADDVIFCEWVRIYDISTRFGIDFSSLPLHRALEKERNHYITLLKSALSWPEELMNYLENKSIPWKTLNLVSKFTASQLLLTSDYVRQTSPSTQHFKIFTETVRDFSDDITADIYNRHEFQNLTDRRSPLHREIDDLMKLLQEGTVRATNDNRFETHDLSWNFTTANLEQFETALDRLMKLKETTARLYDMLEGKFDTR